MESHNKKQIRKSKFKIDEVTLVLLVAVFIIALGIYHDKSGQQTIDAEKITNILMDDHDLSFASGGVVNSDKLALIQKMDYDHLKDYLNVNSDFCLYLEDEKGEIILAKGSSKLNQDGLSCR